MSTDRFLWHNTVIESQLQGMDKTKLITGHKKDVILDKGLLDPKYINNVSIFGWWQLNGVAIQGPGPNHVSHDKHYSDYSHSARFIFQDVIVNNSTMRIFDVLNNTNLCHLISNEGNYDAKNIYNS
jgi:hypothetical protein